MPTQKTLSGTSRLKGKGLHTGASVQLELHPAEADSGITFVRTDLPGNPSVQACTRYSGKKPRCTSLIRGEAEVQTIEHLMSALFATGVTNLEVHIDGPELPGMDGSALPFYEACKEAGVQQQDSEAVELGVDQPIFVSQGDSSVLARPNPDGLRVSYTLDYDNPILPTQHLSISIDEEVYAREIAPARTFVLLEEVKKLQKAGLGKGADPSNTLVLGPDGIIDNSLRFEDEFVRHKILDLLGDLYLANAAIRADITAIKSGHSLNASLAEAFLQDGGARSNGKAAVLDPSMENGPAILEGSSDSVINSAEISRILPHRYPFLLVDKIINLVANKSATGVKCVTVNEEFFQGHFPGNPVMPGVLIVEALAQVGGIILKAGEEHKNSSAYLLSLDKVKFRRPVVPGDQVLLQVDAVRIRSRSAHVKGRALVDDQVVAEAEIRYALLPSERSNQMGA
ncbi:MAG: UDP-3-O-acyl-N-acetylglucosamine deacetylase [Planctomycetota bacterium]|nr:UDP-3-O-acyl-N-acetylglucosamine deacetylase [Planctomycetota bacterium]